MTDHDYDKVDTIANVLIGKLKVDVELFLKTSTLTLEERQALYQCIKDYGNNLLCDLEYPTN